MKDTALLDKMYDLNLTYFKELSMYILAGKKKLLGGQKHSACGTPEKGGNFGTARRCSGSEGSGLYVQPF